MKIVSELTPCWGGRANLLGRQCLRVLALHLRWAVALGISAGAHGTSLAALAQPLEISRTLSAEPDQRFETLMQQAEVLANQSMQQAFASRASDITTVSVQIVGEHDGLVSPLLSVTVGRDQWQKHPGIRPWARYFSESKRLLGFVEPGSLPLVAKMIPDTVNSDNEPNFYR